MGKGELMRAATKENAMCNCNNIDDTAAAEASRVARLEMIRDIVPTPLRGNTTLAEIDAEKGQPGDPHHSAAGIGGQGSPDEALLVTLEHIAGEARQKMIETQNSESK